MMLVLAACVAIFFWFKAASNKVKEVNSRFEALATSNGLNIFKRYDVTGGVLGLDDARSSMLWVSLVDKSAYKILRAEDVRNVSHEVKPFANNKTLHDIVFTTNDVKDPSFKLKFGLGKDAAEDFYRRIGILFNLR